jgi:hypothetical protein
MIRQPLRVNIELSRSEEDAEHQVIVLKRLALLFDEVIVTAPAGRMLSEEFLQNPKYVTRRAAGRLEIHDFNYYRDTDKGWRLTLESLSPPELKDTVLGLQEARILHEPDWSIIETDEFKQLRSELLSLDIDDPQFNALSETEPEDYKEPPITVLGVRDSRGRRRKLYWVDVPNAVVDSEAISSCLYISQQMRSSPVILNARHRAELAYKFEQLKQASRTMPEKFSQQLGLTDNRTRLGDVAFHVAREIIPESAIKALTLPQLLKYRSELADARAKYVRGDLSELADLLRESPWGEKTRTEVESYVSGKLQTDMAEYEAQSRTMFRKLFGELASYASKVGLSGGVGAVAGTAVLGQVIPGATPWMLFIGGALLAAVKEGPAAIKSLIDYWGQRRDAGSSSIAYVSEVSRRLEPLSTKRKLARKLPSR